MYLIYWSVPYEGTMEIELKTIEDVKNWIKDKKQTYDNISIVKVEKYIDIYQLMKDENV